MLMNCKKQEFQQDQSGIIQKMFRYKFKNFDIEYFLSEII